MNQSTKQALAYFGLGTGLIILSALPGVISSLFFVIFGVFCLVICGVYYFNSRHEQQGLQKVIKFFDSIPIMHLILFLSMFKFGIYLIQEVNPLAGILFVMLAYIIYGWAIGKMFGKSLRQIFNQLNIFMPSPVIPKEFKCPDWRL